MKTLIVYAHPNPQSFNHAILETTRQALTAQGAEVKVVDLYADGFNPVLSAADFTSLQQGTTPADIAAQQALVSWAEAMVFIYPLWWYDRPAMLKGWIDRVFMHGFAFRYGPQGAQGLLTTRRALVLVTAGGPDTAFAQLGQHKAVEHAMVDGTLKFCGISDVRSHLFYQVPSTTPEARTTMLAEVSALATALVQA